MKNASPMVAMKQRDLRLIHSGRKTMRSVRSPERDHHPSGGNESCPRRQADFPADPT
jgi:hypothetical protein